MVRSTQQPDKARLARALPFLEPHAASVQKPTPHDLALRLRNEAELGLLMAEDSLARAQSTVNYYKTRLATLPVQPLAHSSPPAPARPPRGPASPSVSSGLAAVLLVVVALIVFMR